MIDYFKWRFDDAIEYCKSLLRPKPNILKYDYMTKVESKPKEIKWKQCETCLVWGAPQEFVYLPKIGGRIVMDVCGFCGKEFKSYSKTYYHPDKHPKQKVKIEIEEITEDPRSI